MTSTGTTSVVSLGGESRVTRRLDWAEQAEGHPIFIRESLTGLGMSRGALTEALRLEESRQRSVAGAVGSWNRPGQPAFGTIDDAQSYRTDQLLEIRRDFLSRVRDLWEGRQFEVEDSAVAEAEIPLYLLTAPAVTGAGVELESSDTTSGSVGWSVKIFGTGLDGGLEGTTSISADFVAGAGEARRAFLPVRVKTDKVHVLKRGKVIGRGFVHSVEQFENMHPGARPADLRTAVRRVESRPDVYPLERDPADHLNTYVIDQVSSRGHTLSIGFAAFGQDQKVTAEIGLQHEVKLTCKLPGGHRYLAYPVEGDDGVLWEVQAH